MIHALVELKSQQLNSGQCPTVSIEDVHAAVEHLLRPEGFGNFETWRQRLQDQFDAGTYQSAMRMLTLLCRSREGRMRADLINELMKGPKPPDPDATERLTSDLLVILMRDGYLVETNGRYAFRSFLLREYWFRREVR